MDKSNEHRVDSQVTPLEQAQEKAGQQSDKKVMFRSKSGKGVNLHKSQPGRSSVPHIPDGFYDKYYSRKKFYINHNPKGTKPSAMDLPSHVINRMCVAMDKSATRAVILNKGFAREALRPKLPSGVFSSLYDNDHLSDGNMTLSARYESRPPVMEDLDTPSPTAYNLPTRPPHHTRAPEYTFGEREPDKEGGGRMGWQRPYMRSSTPFNYKSDYERKWPTPTSHNMRSTIARRQVTKFTYPSFTFGSRPKKSVWTPTQVPAPNHYYPELVQHNIQPAAPRYSLASRINPQRSLNVPPPDSYNVIYPHRPDAPAFSFDLQRRFVKRHETGPFCAA